MENAILFDLLQHYLINTYEISGKINEHSVCLLEKYIEFDVGWGCWGCWGTKCIFPGVKIFDVLYTSNVYKHVFMYKNYLFIEVA